MERIEKRKRFRIEVLEGRIAPSAAGLGHALSSPGSDHRSDNATSHLEANLARQSPPPPHAPPPPLPPPPELDIEPPPILVERAPS
jgi:hypothetical protein